MPTLNVVTDTIVVQTAAQWAVDATVYINRQILITSDATYGSTDQRKFKIADGTQTWTNLDYFPVSGYDDATSSIQTQLNTKSAGDLSFYRKTGVTTLERWYSSAITSFASTTVGGLTQNLLRAIPFIVSKTITLDRIAMEITTGGTAASLLRIGIYSSTNNLPDALVLDAGTIACDSATFQSITINQQLTPGLYWFAFVHNSASTPVFRAIPLTSIPNVLGVPETLGTGTYQSVISSTFTFGALPDPFDNTGIAAAAINVPIISVRLSA